MLNELRDLDFNDIGSAPASVRYVILGFLLAIILGIGYFLLIKDKVQQLEMVQNLENSLRAEFEQKQSKAANLEAYEAQLAEIHFRDDKTFDLAALDNFADAFFRERPHGYRSQETAFHAFATSLHHRMPGRTRRATE